MGSGSKRRKGKLSAAALGLLVAAVVLRAFIPFGYMPNQDGDSGAFIVICSGGVLKTLRLDTGDGAPEPATPDPASPDPSSVADEDPCPFGVLASAGLDVARPADVGVPTAYRRIAYLHIDSVCAERFSCHVRPSRGPPLQA